MCIHLFYGKMWLKRGRKTRISQYKANQEQKGEIMEVLLPLGRLTHPRRCHAHALHGLTHRLLSITLGFVFTAFSHFRYVFIL